MNDGSIRFKLVKQLNKLIRFLAEYAKTYNNRKLCLMFQTSNLNSENRLSGALPACSCGAQSRWPSVISCSCYSHKSPKTTYKTTGNQYKYETRHLQITATTHYRSQIKGTSKDICTLPTVVIFWGIKSQIPQLT